MACQDQWRCFPVACTNGRPHIPPLTQAPIQDEGYVYKYCILYYSSNPQKVYVQVVALSMIQDARDVVVIFFPHTPQGSTTALFHCYSRGNLQRNVYVWFPCYLTHCVPYRLNMLDRVSFRESPRLVWFSFSVASITHMPQTTTLFSPQTISSFHNLSSAVRVPHIKNSVNSIIIIVAYRKRSKTGFFCGSLGIWKCRSPDKSICAHVLQVINDLKN